MEGMIVPEDKSLLTFVENAEEARSIISDYYKVAVSPMQET